MTGSNADESRLKCIAPHVIYLMRLQRCLRVWLLIAWQLQCNVRPTFTDGLLCLRIPFTSHHCCGLSLCSPGECSLNYDCWCSMICNRVQTNAIFRLLELVLLMRLFVIMADSNRSELKHYTFVALRHNSIISMTNTRSKEIQFNDIGQ